MPSDAETYFIRHTADLDIDDKTRDRLWNENKIAIHFPHYADNRNIERHRDNSSLDPKDYRPRDAGVIARLLELAKNGGYVCAEYFPRNECLVGYIRPNSKIELVRGSWGTLNDLEGREAILKSLKVTKPRIIPEASLATILVGRPIRGTISRWPNAKAAIRNIVEGKAVEPCLDLLFPYQQEIMCSEFLRTADAENLGVPRMVYLLLPVGRTMKDLDICGITANGKRVLAQVTYRKLEDAQGKLAKLTEYRADPGDTLILFCRSEVQTEREQVKVVPLDTVYEQFTSSRGGRAWLKAAISEICPTI